MLYWGYGFGVWLGFGFRVCFLAGDWLQGRTQRTWTCSSEKNYEKRKKKKKTRKTFNNLFCFDVFGYKESTRKENKIIRK